MADKVVLHVGLMKSGTTFIQRQLFAHQSTLRDRGTLVPGTKWGEQVTAVSDGLRRDGNHDGSWDALTAQINDWSGHAVVSMEFLGPAPPRVIGRLVRSFAPARVEVVVTARDLNRSIAALWQETIQNGRSWTWPEYVAGLRAACPWHDPAEITEAGRTFWRQQDLSRIAAAWGNETDRVTVVTVPHPGAARGELLDQADVLRALRAAAPRPSRRASPSATAGRSSSTRTWAWSPRSSTSPRSPALDGHLAIGHSRYSTTGADTWENAQPTFRSTAAARSPWATTGT